MAENFDELIHTSNAFFKELWVNNTEEWFADKEWFYTQQIKKPAERLAINFIDELLRLTGKAHSFRIHPIHRYVYFNGISKTTPYNAFLAIHWKQPERSAPSWVLSSSEHHLSLEMGYDFLKEPHLSNYRIFVDRHGAELEAALKAAMRAGATVRPNRLTDVPASYMQYHPHAYLLKDRSLMLEVKPKNWKAKGLVATMAGIAEALLPVWKLMDKHLG